MTDNGLAALAEALRAILSDFDREPDDEYMAVAVPMFLSLLPPDWCGHKTAVMLEQEAEAHESTIATLRAALDGLVYFAWHKPTCGFLRSSTVSHRVICNCGLTAALAAKETP